MDKWKLLRSALQGKRESDSSASIHRNDGIFSVIDKRPRAWEWSMNYVLAEDTNLDAVKEDCRAYMTARDVTEIILRLCVRDSSPESKAQLRCLLSDAVDAGHCRLKQEKCLTTEEDVDESAISSMEVCWHDNSFTPTMTNCKYHEWTLPSGDKLLAREKAKDAGIGITQLLSHKLYGVDNTGNVKVWAAESMLLHVLLMNYSSEFENRSVLELGGGLTALCALGMSASIPSCTIVATDGHPDCVTNQMVCVHMNEQVRSSEDTGSGSLSPLRVTSQLLKWMKDDPQQELARILEGNKEFSSDTDGKFDRIIAADCLFFRDFHSDLVWLLQAALAKDGIIFMLQPPRGGTMDEFLAKAELAFSIAIITDYDAKITTLHQEYMSNSGGDKTAYDPDIHYPVLLVLTHKKEGEVPMQTLTSI
mmetsp:Transcript_12460/g.20251  ORF Transcript_12460/g.20251 Transcript_12460/m.20251 type:complete len:420 (+) Transcript_12460:113-1372(+)